MRRCGAALLYTPSIFINLIQPLVKAWVAELPLHATLLHNNNHNASWVCNSGFFKTFPADLHLSTCKRCTPLNASQCSRDSFFVACGPERDAHCGQCNPLPQGWEYTPNIHDCQSRQCALGYFVTTPDASTPTSVACTPCPVGSFCDNHVSKEDCGEGLSTLREEESSPLSCIPMQPSLMQEIHVTLTFSIPSLSANHVFCPRINDLLSTWLLFGRLVECTVTRHQASGADIDCIILIAERYIQEYLLWLYSMLEMQEGWMKSFLLSCVQKQDASMASWDIKVSDLPARSNPLLYYYTLPNSSAYYLVNNVSKGSSSTVNLQQNRTGLVAPPHIFHHALHWGNHAHDVAHFILAAAILGCSTCLAIAIMISGIIIRNRKQRKIKQILVEQAVLIKSQL
jgi:hypothetical protein